VKRARWVLPFPKSDASIIGQAIIASWWPWTYYYVSTVELDRQSPLRRLTRSLTTGVYSDEPLPEGYVTQVFRCNKEGVVKNRKEVYYEQEYHTHAEAEAGHESTVNGVAGGTLPLKLLPRDF